MISAGTIADLFDVDQKTGHLMWKIRPSNSAHADLSAGYRDGRSGYVKVMVKGVTYQAHRIVWALVHGRWPVGHIDHINGDRSDNRPVNLRDVTPAENQKNCRLDKRNISGVSGVRWRSDRLAWEASIRVGGRLKHLGRFQDLGSASFARRQAEIEAGFHENHGRKKPQEKG